MNLSEIARTFLYPFRELAILATALMFWLIYSVAKFAAIVLMPVGIIGAVILLAWSTPAYFRYLMFLLEARADGKPAPTFDAELFALTDKLWTLTPLLLIALLVWGWFAIAEYGVVWSGIYGFLIIAVLPASVAVLAITHSPLESVNPIAISRMIRVCGRQYFLIPLVIVSAFIFLRLLAADGAPLIIVEWASIYLSLFMVAFTGALLHAKNVTLEVDIAPPLEATKEKIASDLDRERQQVIGHAYGFISRGNREGGFAHILDWVQKEPDVHAASAWFFEAMMKWESKEPALFYGQTYLAHLLHHEDDASALKLLSACLHADATWRPRRDDRDAVDELVAKYARQDLLELLR